MSKPKKRSARPSSATKAASLKDLAPGTRAQKLTKGGKRTTVQDAHDKFA